MVSGGGSVGKAISKRFNSKYVFNKSDNGRKCFRQVVKRVAGKKDSRRNDVKWNKLIKSKCLMASTNYRKCNDNYVGKVNLTCSDIWVLPHLRIKNKDLVGKKFARNNIIILMESPRIDEFTYSFIAPALGKTGVKIH